MQKRILTLEHFRADGPGEILGWVARRGHALQRVYWDEGQKPPAHDGYDFLIVMGGPMNIYEHDAHPWLIEEKQFLREAIAAGKPVLGICLGAQLLADVLGGKVTRNREKEIGWWPVQFTTRVGPLAEFPENLTVFHWHGDTFSIPPGAVPLATSEGCENQAFLKGDRLVGLQFHIEVGKVEALDLTSACAADLAPSHYVQTPEQILAPPPETEKLGAVLDGLLDALAGKVLP